MNILILGGTGVMGKDVTNILASMHHSITVTSRRALESSANVRYIQGNAKDSNFLSDLLQHHWDVIIDFMVYTTDQFKERIDLLLNSTSQYIFLSSSRVYANADGVLTENSIRLLDESKDTRFLQTDDYALRKARSEDVLLKSGKRNWTIIRPYITYGENRLQLGAYEKENWLYRALQGRTIVLDKNIAQAYTTLTFGLDVAKGICSIVGEKNAIGEIYNITQSKSHKWEDILSIYKKCIKDTLDINCKILIIDKKAEGYTVTYDRVYNRIFDNRKISNFICTDNFEDVNSGLYRCTKQFLQNPQFGKCLNGRTEGVNDKISKEYTPLKDFSGFKNKLKYLIFRYIL